MSQAKALLDQIDREIRDDARVNSYVDELHIFAKPPTHQPRKYLEDKMREAERLDRLNDAKEAKEFFQKLLDRYVHYESAQKLFAFFLARVKYTFNQKILPNQHSLSQKQVDEIVDSEIIQPILAEMGEGLPHFQLSHEHLNGMVYWLADICHVRWK